MKQSFLLSEESTKNSALKKRIIQYLILSGESSIADLSKEIELSIPTVTKLVMELMDDGFILDSGKQNTSGGRRPNIYGINPESGYFVGVDVQRKRISIAAIDFNGRIIDEELNIPYKMENTPEALHKLCELINTYIASLPVEKEKILQIGVNLSGRVNTTAGYSYSFFGFDEEPLAQTMERKLDIPVTLENDSRAMAYGEYIAGIVRGEKNVIFINMNWGLGSGMILDGKLYYGKSGFSGEFGHISAFDNEIICGCGKKGCVETEASGYAIQRKLKEKYDQGSTTSLGNILEKGEVTLREFVDAVLKEDVLAIEVLESVGQSLGRWVAGLINIFNPELVILGGPLSLTHDYIRLPVKGAMRKYSLNLVNQDTDLVVSRLGDKAGLIGACLLTRSKMLGII